MKPYVTGGNPVIAGDKALFNDILGTTQGSTDGKEFSQINRDAFGQTLDNSTDSDYDYFTGKPKVEGLGYAFLFRNYNAGLGKWTTSDPLGYPDGWNNFAYCNNRTTSCFDWLGGSLSHATVEIQNLKFTVSPKMLVTETANSITHKIISIGTVTWTNHSEGVNMDAVWCIYS